MWESACTFFLALIPDVTDKPRGLAFIEDTLYIGMPNSSTSAILIKKADMLTTPLSFEDDNTFANSGLRWMGEFGGQLHFMTISLEDPFNSEIWGKGGSD